MRHLKWKVSLISKYTKLSDIAMAVSSISSRECHHKPSCIEDSKVGTGRKEIHVIRDQRSPLPYSSLPCHYPLGHDEITHMNGLTDYSSTDTMNGSVQRLIILLWLGCTIKYKYNVLKVISVSNHSQEWSDMV